MDDGLPEGMGTRVAKLETKVDHLPGKGFIISVVATGLALLSGGGPAAEQAAAFRGPHLGTAIEHHTTSNQPASPVTCRSSMSDSIAHLPGLSATKATCLVLPGPTSTESRQ